MARRALGVLAVLAAAMAPPGAAQLRLAEIPVGGRAGLDSLAGLGFEVADVRRVSGALYAVIVVAPEMEQLLARRGYAPRPVAGAPTPGPAADTFKVYRSFDKPGSGIRATLEAWTAADTLLHLDSVGASVEGRPMLAMKIGAATDAPARPNVLFMAMHHAREWVSTEVAMKLIRWIVDSLPRPLLAARDIWVIPVENPDGYQYTFTDDRLWRKNRRPNADGTFGVDPNRNYPAFWGVDNLGSSGAPGAEIYRGVGPASEPETQAILAFHAAHPPVVAVSYHTYSGLVLYPYGFRSGLLAPDLTLFQALAGTDLLPAVPDNLPGSTLEHYHPGPGWHLYPTNGEYTDWVYRTYGTIAFTPELTGGCCVDGVYYGFTFPDDSALVEQVFRDNLAFAVSVIVAAGDLRGARGASGLAPAAPRFVAVWPETWLSLDAAAPRPLSLTLRTATGGVAIRSAQTDSLSRGTIRTVWRSDVSADTVRAVRADGTGLHAELLSLGGAEALDAGWTGWSRDTVAFVGARAWTTNRSDTLTSPVVSLAAPVRGLWLQFWTLHRGSTFTPEQRGVVQVSTDSGGSWADVAIVLGDGPSWYPVRVDLPSLAATAGRIGLRVRFVSAGLPWSVDAVGFATDSTAAFQLLAAPGDAEVSENPVRGDQVVISWPAGTGEARVTIYSFTGERLVQALVAAPTNEYAWNLVARGRGRRVVNGAYVVVVDVDGRRYRRRLFVSRHGPP